MAASLFRLKSPVFSTQKKLLSSMLMAAVNPLLFSSHQNLHHGRAALAELEEVISTLNRGNTVGYVRGKYIHKLSGQAVGFRPAL